MYFTRLEVVQLPSVREHTPSGVVSIRSAPGRAGAEPHDVPAEWRTVRA